MNAFVLCALACCTPIGSQSLSVFVLCLPCRLVEGEHIVNSLHLTFDASSRHYDLHLQRVNLWAARAKLLVNDASGKRELPLPMLPAYRGHMANAEGGTVSAAILADGSYNIHIFEGAQIGSRSHAKMGQRSNGDA